MPYRTKLNYTGSLFANAFTYLGLVGNGGMGYKYYYYYYHSSIPY